MSDLVSLKFNKRTKLYIENKRQQRQAQAQDRCCGKAYLGGVWEC